MSPPAPPISPIRRTLDADGIAWISFGAPALNPSTLAALEAEIAWAEASKARAIVITGRSGRIFIAGADLHWLARLPDEASAILVSHSGQAVFDRIEHSAVPVVCAIQGAAAGGGFELALACHWRLASDSESTRLGLPETGLGTVPGWGGTVRLPRLIGAEAALSHLLRAQLLPAPAALQAGLIDEVVPAARLLDRAGAAARAFAGADGRHPVRALPPIPVREAFGDFRAQARHSAPGVREAAAEAIDLVERGLDLDGAAAFAAESSAFGRLTMRPACKHLIRSFFLREAARKRTLEGWFPAPQPTVPPAGRIGVVGAGIMGSGIAHWLAVRGCDVALRDSNPDMLVRGLGSVRQLLDESVARGRLTALESAAALGRIAATTDWSGFADCDLVIEAIFEDAGRKRALFTELAEQVPEGTVLASNTSALPIEEIAGHIPNPGRALGLHFFNPVSRMALVELVLGRGTTAEAAARALALVRRVGKSPVICRSSPGLLVTRILFFYLNEAVRLWEQGVPGDVLDASLRAEGWPMGPLRLIDEVGLDVTDLIFGELARYFPGRFEPTRACRRLLEAKLLGRKLGTSSGFYRYDLRPETNNDRRARAVAGFTREIRDGLPELSGHLMSVMTAEAQRCLEEGVVRSRDDIEFALMSGAGLPAGFGGLFRPAAAPFSP